MAGLSPIPLIQAQGIKILTETLDRTITAALQQPQGNQLGERTIQEAPVVSPVVSNKKVPIQEAPVVSNKKVPPGLRDYQHASKTFIADNFRLFPKQSFLFHLFIELNPLAIKDSNSMNNADTQRELSLMVKTVDLPKFTIDTKTFNAYNRPNVIQNKIKYDLVNINFHDDSADVVRKFWYDYYSYHYRDADHADELYGISTKYKPRHTMEWGFSPREEVNYIKTIKIYSLHQKLFSEYTLFNPIITSWAHGKHSMEGRELLDNTMSVSYESIQYKQGTVSENAVAGFGSELHYDKTTSPNIEKLRATASNNQIKESSLADMRKAQSVSMTSYNVESISTAATANLTQPLQIADVSQYRIVVPVATTFDQSIKAASATIPSSTRTII